MKIVSTGSTISSPEFQRKKYHARRRRLVFASAAAFCLLVGAILILRMESLRIASVEVSGALVTGASPVEATVREVISGNYFWLIPRSSAVLYPGSALKETLLERFPRLASIAISLDDLRKLKVEVLEREPFALYCADGACYFLDESGFVFDTAPTFSDGVYFVYAADIPLESPLGRELLPPERFRTLSSLVKDLERLGLEPRTLETGSDSERLVLASGAVILWSAKSDPALVYSNLESFLNNEAIKSRKDFWQRVATVDLRTENKVFYTFK